MLASLSVNLGLVFFFCCCFSLECECVLNTHICFHLYNLQFSNKQQMGEQYPKEQCPNCLVLNIKGVPSPFIKTGPNPLYRQH